MEVSLNHYTIKDWDSLYENNKSRERDRCSFACIPNKQDGLGYGKLLRWSENGPALYGAFVAVVLMASKQKRPRHGHLTDTGRAPDRHLTAEDISLKTQIPEPIIAEMLEAASSQDVGWLTHTDEVPDQCPTSARLVPARCLGREGKGKERKRREEKEIYCPAARVALHWLNQESGKGFRECASSLEPINARLKEPDVDIEGVKQMISRQCNLWKGTRMAEYLRPSTLFGKEKFNEYYASRNQPINLNDHKQGAQRIDRNAETANEGLASQYEGLGRVAKT